MNAGVCINAVKESNKYNFICDETIERLVENEIKKYRSEKEVIKSVKTKLHRITGAFIGESDIQNAYNVLQNAFGILQKADGITSQSTPEAANEQSFGESIRQILSLHASTRERMGFMEEMFRDIFAVTGEDCRILDIACGFNPFFLALYSGTVCEKYYASDINTRLIDLLNYFFLKTNINGQAFASDILYRIPDIRVSNVFLFKIIPLIEQQQKGYSKVVADRLKSEFLTITFPTKSLSGKNVGMYRFYNELMKNYFCEAEYEYCLEKEYGNEVLYIIRRRKQSG